VLANDTDAEGDTISIASVDTALTNGAVTCNDATGDCTYMPPAGGGFIGDDTFTYVANDGRTSPDGDSAPATVTVTVSPVVTNVAPVANDDVYTIGEAGILTGNVKDNDTDADVGDLDLATTTLVGAPPANVAFSFNSDGTFSYQSDANFNGDVSFAYELSDPSGATDQAVVNITVTPQNDLPKAVPDTRFIFQSPLPTTVTVSILTNDTDIDADPAIPMTALLDTSVNAPAELVLNADGTFDYTADPARDTVGEANSFTYQAYDGIGSSAPAIVTLVQKLSVFEAICEWEPQQGGRCDWRIEGQKLDPDMQTVQAWSDGVMIGETVAGAGVWNITDNNNRDVNPPVGDSVSIDIVVVGDADAKVPGYTSVSQQ